jgi:demethylmacrocin O-methyltransferase
MSAYVDRARRFTVEHVKPHVPDRAWRRLRRLAPSRPATPNPRQERAQRLLSLDLTELAQEFGSDKWGVHRYTPHYERHFTPLRDRSELVLELGIGGYAREKQGGASLKMWKWFFPHAQIVGVDIEDKSFVDQPRITSYLGSQTDRSLMERIVREHGAPMVVIDDGSHRPQDVVGSFEILFPLLADDGLYVVEDTQTSYWPQWGGNLDPADPSPAVVLLRRLLDGLNHEEFLHDDYEPTYTDRHVVAVHCYHNLVVIEKGENSEGSNKRIANRKWYRENT